MVRSQRPDIEIVRLTWADDVDLEPLTSELQSITSLIAVRTESPGAHATFEWLLPASLAIAVGAPFLKGFLEKLGESTAESLAKLLQRLFEKLKSKKNTWHKAEDAPALLVSPIEVNLELPNDLIAEKTLARFVFPADLDEEQFEKAIRGVRAGLKKASARDAARMEYQANLRKLLDAGEADAAIELRLSEDAIPLRVSKLTYVFRSQESEWIDGDDLIRREVEGRGR